MFETLSERFKPVLARLTRKGHLRKADIDATLSEVRQVLIEADVAVEVAQSFCACVREKATGHEVLKAVNPGQMVIKIVFDALVVTLGGSHVELSIQGPAPVAIMMVGLQGSGKTSSAAKLARRLKTTAKKRVLLASLDIYRPAAMEQLRLLAEQAESDFLPVIPNQDPIDIASRALQAARLGGHDVLILDTAGRTTVDDAMMQEARDIRNQTNPAEVLLVADSLMGQDAVRIASAFHREVPVTGIVLTRMDGDSRGGAALSMREVTGAPIKFVGIGEAVRDFEDFHPDRMANRILGMGDIVSLVERAEEERDADDSAKLQRNLERGRFTLDDFAKQLAQVQRMGGSGKIMNMMPGLAQSGGNEEANDKQIARQIAICQSMTPAEKRNPKIINSSRRKRIARGSGTKVQDINRLTKLHREIGKFIKTAQSPGSGTLARLGSMFGLKNGPPGQITGGMPGMPKSLPNPSQSGQPDIDFDQISAQVGANSLPVGVKRARRVRKRRR